MSYQEALARLRHSKYRAKPQRIDGIYFASKREAAVYQELKLLERAGKINSIWPQYPFVLTTTDARGMKHKVGVHKVDFRYWDCETKQFKYLEVKGNDHADGRLRRRWVEAEHGVVIEVKK